MAVMAGNRRYETAGRSPGPHSGVSAFRRAAPAERPAAAQHLRAALSRDGRRGARRRPPDRHDPAGPRRGAKAQPAARFARSAASGASRSSPRPATAATRSCSPASAASASSRSSPLTRLSGSAAIFGRGLRRSDRAAPRRGRRSTARRCSAPSATISRPTTSTPIGRASNRASNAGLVTALSMMSPWGPPEKQALLESPDHAARARTLIAITEMALAGGECARRAAAMRSEADG